MVGEKGHGDNYGLGAKETFAILEIAEMFGGEIEFLEARPGNRMSASLDTSRSTGELGWEPKVSVRDYIQKYVDSLK